MYKKLLLLIPLGVLMACNGENDKTIKQSESQTSKAASDLPSASKKKVSDEDVILVPNQFPLEDGKLPKQKKENEKAGNKK